MKTKIVYSEICLEYGGINAFENAERVLSAAKILKSKGYEFIEPQPGQDADILRAHNQNYFDAVKNGKVEDADTPAYEKIFDHAKLAAGGAILAAKISGFSLLRPPGHHAGKNGKALGASTRGFCYFNNIAIAAKSLNKKVFIIDIDGHHGNGTQEIVAGDENIHYLSLHRQNAFPQTGHNIGQNCRNYPLPADCGAKIYLKTFKKALQDSQKEIQDAEIVAVSAGFDTHFGDIVSLGLQTPDYSQIGKMIAQLGKPVFFTLEGGYNGQNLGNDIDAFLKGFENRS